MTTGSGGRRPDHVETDPSGLLTRQEKTRIRSGSRSKALQIMSQSEKYHDEFLAYYQKVKKPTKRKTDFERQKIADDARREAFKMLLSRYRADYEALYYSILRERVDALVAKKMKEGSDAREAHVG